MDSPKQVGASFGPAVAHLRVVVKGSDKGFVTGPKIRCGRACVAAYLQGTSVTLTATTRKGDVFAGWGGACAAAQGATCTLTPGSSTIVTATFASS
jgi:uncharacterized repeat protein (TIGR02543 family)